MPVSEAETFFREDTAGLAPQGDESPMAVAASGQPMASLRPQRLAVSLFPMPALAGASSSAGFPLSRESPSFWVKPEGQPTPRRDEFPKGGEHRDDAQGISEGFCSPGSSVWSPWLPQLSTVM